MKLVQPVLLVMLGLALIVYLRFVGTRTVGRIGVVVGFSLAAVLVVFPDLSHRVAAVFGVGRGVDLVIYLALVGILQLLVRIFATLREQDRRITLLTRRLAIEEAEPANDARTAPAPSA